MKPTPENRRKLLETGKVPCFLTLYVYHLFIPATEWHHIIPRSRGGCDRWDNLMPINRMQHNRITGMWNGVEWREPLIRLAFNWGTQMMQNNYGKNWQERLLRGEKVFKEVC